MKTTRTMRFLAIAFGSLLAACTTSGSTTSSPVPPTNGGATPGPSEVSAVVDNPYFPLTPGTTLVYRGTKDGRQAVDTYSVTDHTKMVDGVPCVVVRDVLTLDGEVAETTLDYYTQDFAGNVWYFGEDTAELNHKGQIVSTSGTWHAGVQGAQPGIFMTATPEIGTDYRQEYLKGEAEDHFAAIDASAAVKVPYGSYNDALLTKEWTPLEPNVLDHKYYVGGIGEVAEISVKGPTEHLELVEVRPPSPGTP